MRRTIITGLATLLLFGPALAQEAAPYRLGVRDKVRLRVFEYRAAVDDIYEWKSLNFDYAVGPGGTLSLPLLGDVPAAGKTPSELAAGIGEAMRTRLGVATPPPVGVDIVEYRPFYIVGSVDKPGEYPYRPGLTVLQAMSIAGGLPREETLGLRFGREIISGRGDVEVLALSLADLMARRARLEAERDGAADLAFPGDLVSRKTETPVATAMAQETRLFETRRQTLATEIEALQNLKATLTQEITSLEGQLKAQERERVTVQKELAGISSLVEKGLAVAPRQLGLERVVAQLDGDRLRMETLMIKARQDITRADISIIETRNKRTSEIVESLREVQAKLDEATGKYATAERLLAETEMVAPRMDAERRSGALAPKFFRVPEGGAGAGEPATEATRVAPGDTIKVELPPPAGFGAGWGRATATGPRASATQ